MKEDRVLSLFLAQSLCSSVLGSEMRKKLAELMSTRPLLILYSIPRRICRLRCSSLILVNSLCVCLFLCLFALFYMQTL